MKFAETTFDLVIFTIGLIAAVLAAGAFVIVRPDLGHHVLLVISGALMLTGIRALNKYSAQQNWVEAKAVLRSVKERKKSIIESVYSGKREYFYPEVEYEYTHDGQRYTGAFVVDSIKDIWVPEITLLGDKTPESKKAWLNWEPGLQVPVYVNPKNPHEVVLINTPGKSRRSHYYALIVSGILIFLLWLAMVVTT